MQPQVIAVWGATGSPGRTTVAINVAAEIAHLGLRTVLVDADSYGAAVSHYLGIQDEASGLAAMCRLAEMDALDDEALSNHCYQLSVGDNWLQVVTGINRPERWPELGAERIKKVIVMLRAHCDVVVIDVGFNLETDEEITSDLFSPRRNAATISSLNNSDLVLEVVASDPLSLTRFIRAHQVLAQQYSQLERRTVMNKASGGSDGSIASLQRFAGIAHISQLRADPSSMMKVYNTQQPLCVCAPTSGLRNDVRALVQEIFPELLPANQPKAGWFFRTRELRG